MPNDRPGWSFDERPQQECMITGGEVAALLRPVCQRSLQRQVADAVIPFSVMARGIASVGWLSLDIGGKSRKAMGAILVPHPLPLSPPLLRPLETVAVSDCRLTSWLLRRHGHCSQFQCHVNVSQRPSN